MIYLGRVGRMIGIKCPSSQQIENEPRHSFQRTLEGKRKGQSLPLNRRTWSLQTSQATSQEHVSNLNMFADGLWGPGPFWFVSADAPFTNLLTPDVSTCGEAAAYGAQVSSVGELYLGKGVYAPRSLLNANPGTLMYFGGIRTPLVDRRRVTGSAWVKGANARVGLYWYNEAGSFLSATVSGEAATATTIIRSTVSAIPPVGAVSCLVAAIDTVSAAQPAISWTDTAEPWSIGQGCHKAVVDSVSRDLVMTGRNGTYSSLSFTVTEVG